MICLFLMFLKYRSDSDGTRLKHEINPAARWSQRESAAGNEASCHLPPVTFTYVPYMSPMLAYSLIWPYNLNDLLPVFEGSSLLSTVWYSCYPQSLASSTIFSGKASVMPCHPFRQNWVLPFIGCCCTQLHTFIGVYKHMYCNCPSVTRLYSR